MNSLILKGRIKVDDMEFIHIEGGFGKDKKAMLAKDIAEIHQREVKVINQAINMNRKRFKDGVDLVDLKGSKFEVNLIDHNILTQMMASKSNNIYLLSERGYSKLLKILEDDFAWEQYEKLVDGYFNMKKSLQEQAPPQINSQFLYQIAQQLEEKEKQIALMIPKAIFADAVTASKTSILVGELAKLLRQNGIDTGQNRLFKWLRDNGYLIKRKGTDYNMPTQYSMELSLFEVKETSITHSDGHISISKTPKVTGKGQVYFINKFKENEVLPVIEQDLVKV